MSGYYMLCVPKYFADYAKYKHKNIKPFPLGSVKFNYLGGDSNFLVLINTIDWNIGFFSLKSYL